MNGLGGCRTLFKLGLQRASPTRALFSNNLCLTSNVQPSKLHPPLRSVGTSTSQRRFKSYEQKAKALNQEGISEELHDYDVAIGEEQEKQRKAPWHREGSQDPPVRKQRTAGAMTKGKNASAVSTSLSTPANARKRETADHSGTPAQIGSPTLDKRSQH